MRRLMIVVAVVAAWSLVTALPSIGAQDSATLVNTVSVAGDPVPCMTLDNTSLDWGVLEFQDPFVLTPAPSGSATVAVTDCSGDTQSLTVAGTPATSTTSSTTWSLVSLYPCDTTNSYAVQAIGDAAAVLLQDAVYQSIGSIGGNATSSVAVDLWMPCEGSDGADETFTFDINFLVTIP